MDSVADAAAEAPSAASLGLSMMRPDALQDSYMAIYVLLVVSPLSSLASHWLLRRGKSSTAWQVLLVSLLVPALLLSVPLWYQWNFHDMSVYRILQMSRTDSRYVWAQKYAYLRHQFQHGDMPLNVWREIDAAYDHLYNEKARFLYDFWGPGHETMSLLETQLHVVFFYILWTAIVFALTSTRAAYGGSKWAYTILVLLFCFEMAVRIMQYDPPIKTIFPFTTPREFVRWGHRLYPIFALAAVSMRKVFFVDLEKHRQTVLRHMLEKNKKTMEELNTIAKELSTEDEDKDEEASKTK